MEDFLNYRKPSMFIGTAFCDFKCEKECGIPCCQNNPLINQPNITLADSIIVNKYINNDITKAVVIGGLEPLLQFDELVALIKAFRAATDDDIVIYTGYYENEVKDKIDILRTFNNIIIKYGRYIPNMPSHLDAVLGVQLASPNQYAEKIS